MKRRIFHKRLFAVSASVVAMLASCEQTSKMKTRSIGVKSTDSVKTVSSLALSFKVVEDIELALVESGMSSDNAKVVSGGALAGLSSASTTQLKLADQTSSEVSLDVLLPLAVGGAVKTLNDPAAGQDSGSKKMGSLSLITKTTFTSLNGHLDNVGPEVKSVIPGKVTKAAMTNLEGLGLSDEDFSSSVGAVMDSAVSNLTTAGYSNTEIKDVMVYTMKSGLEGLKSSNVATGNVASSVTNMISNAVGALGKSGISGAELNTVVGPMMTETVGSLPSLGLSSSAQMQSAVGDVMGGAVKALKKAGVSEAKDVDAIVKDCVQGAMTGASRAGLPPEKIPPLMTDIMKGAVTPLAEIGVTNAGDIQTLTASWSSSAISMFDKFGLKDASVVSSAAKAVATGTMAGLGALKDSGVFDQTALQKTSQAVSQSSINALYQQATGNGFAGEINSLASGFTTGMVNGLAQAGIKATDIYNVTASIAEGCRDALVGQTSFDQSKLGAVVSVVQSSTTSFVNNMRIDCLQQKGIWLDDGRCQYPSSKPVAGATGPTADERDRCAADGGAIAYKSTGAWFCNTSGGSTALADRTGCEGKGYVWARGPSGEYCEVAGLPSSCWKMLE